MKKRIKKLMALLLTASMTAALAGCGGSSTTNESAAEAEDPVETAEAAEETADTGDKVVIKIGVPQPFSGGQSDSGYLGKAGVEAALEYWNQNGGFQNHPEYEVELVYADTESDANVAATQAEKLISSEGVDVLLGGYSSGLVAAMAPLAIKYEVPYLLFPGVANSITAEENDWVFRADPGDELQRLTTVDFVNYLNTISPIKTYAWVGANDESGQSARDMFMDIADELGAECVLDESVQSGAADLSGVVQKIKQSDPDILFTYFYLNEALLFQRQLQEYKVDVTILSRGGGYLESSFLESAGDTAENVMTTSHFVPNTINYLPEEASVWAEWIKDYLDGETMNESSADGWMAMSVLLQALDSTDDVSRQGIRDALAATDMGNDNWALMFQPWYDGISFSSTVSDAGVAMYNVNLSARPEIAQVHDGEWWPVYPEEIFTDSSESPLVYPVTEE